MNCPSPAAARLHILEIVIVFILSPDHGVRRPKIFEQTGKANRRGKIRIQQLLADRDLQLEVGVSENLQALVSSPAAWTSGTALRKERPQGPWGNDYRYRPGQGQAFDLVSLGADGKEGGEGENGRRQLTPRGFTLLEIIVVWSSARCLVLAMPAGHRRRPQGRARARLGLRTRRHAMATRRDALLTVDVERASSSSGDSAQAARRRRPEALHRADRGGERAQGLDPLLSRRQLHRRAHHGLLGRAQVPRGRGLAHGPRLDRRMRQRARSQSGFTLLEVVVAFVVLALDHSPWSSRSSRRGSRAPPALERPLAGARHRAVAARHRRARGGGEGGRGARRERPTGATNGRVSVERHGERARGEHAAAVHLFALSRRGAA